MNYWQQEETEEEKKAVQQAKARLEEMGISGISSFTYHGFSNEKHVVAEKYFGSAALTILVYPTKTIFESGFDSFGTYQEAVSNLLKLMAKQEAEEKERKERERRKKAFWLQDDADILKNIKDSLDMLSDDPITCGSYVGGYDGYSMSNSARYSEENGSLPMSKWTKAEILEQIKDNTDELNAFLPILEKMKKKELIDVCLESDGWHHTSKFYNRTEFYCVASPRNIVGGLIERGLL